MTRTHALVSSFFFAFGLSSIPLQAQAPAIPLTVEKIFAHGPLIGRLPEDIEWSPDGKHLSYLDGGELVDLDPGSGKPHVLVSRSKIKSLEGAPASEQDRDHRARYGMAAYQWAPDSHHLLFDTNGRLWMYDLHNGTGVEIGSSDKPPATIPSSRPMANTFPSSARTASPLCASRMSAFPPEVLAPSPNEATLNGEVDWVYEEELDVRSNYFWSPDSKSIRLPANERERRAGLSAYRLDSNARRRCSPALSAAWRRQSSRSHRRCRRAGRPPLWIKLPINPGQDYVPRLGWVDRKTIWAEVVPRDQKHRILYFADAPERLRARDPQHLRRKIPRRKLQRHSTTARFVLTSWSDGHNHIQLYSYDQAIPRVPPSSKSS